MGQLVLVHSDEMLEFQLHILVSLTKKYPQHLHVERVEISRESVTRPRQAKARYVTRHLRDRDPTRRGMPLDVFRPSPLTAHHTHSVPLRSPSLHSMPPKRKSDADSSAPAKKARASTAHASAAALVHTILADPDAFPIPDDAVAVRASFAALAEYARSLEGAGAAAISNAGSSTVRAKTQEELEAAAEKIRKAAHSGIRKQMTWKLSCKTGAAKWAYDGICPDPEVFGALLGLGGPPKFKQKKMSREEFEGHIGSCEASVRYDTLGITSADVNIRWSDTGEFKFSGSYGRSQFAK